MPYTTATPIKIDGELITVQFTGTGGVKPFEDQTTVRNIEDWARNILTRLNTPQGKTTIVQGTPLDLAPPGPAVLTLEQTWERDASILLRHSQRLASSLFDFLSADDTDIAAAKATAQASHAAYLVAK